MSIKELRCKELKIQEDKEQVGARMLVLRKLLRGKNGKPFNRADFAQELYIDERTLKGHEKGHTFPTVETLRILREKFKVNLNFLVCGKGPVFLPFYFINEPNNRQLEEKLKEIREMRKDPHTQKPYTQKKMALIMGCSAVAWGRYEKGERTPSCDIFAHLFFYFGCDLNALICGK